jgi:predicted TIM-barrel fold metal-dependent hydrolase
MRVAGVSGSLGRRSSVTLLPDPVECELWCPIISGDDHVLEGSDLFTGRVPSRLAGAVPYLVEDEERLPFWVVESAHIPITIGNGSAGRPSAEWNNSAQKFEEFRTGVFDPVARLADMDIAGVWASLCFPSLVWGFAGRVFSTMSDPDVGLACVRAYNGWMLEEWCGSAPERYIPCQLPWLGDPEVAASEIRANAARGFRAVTFPETPDRLGFASIHSGAWDPFFAVCEETGTVVSLHVGSSGWVQRPSPESPVEVAVALFPISGVSALVDWLYARIPLRFPQIKIVLSEAGVSWVPMLLERFEHTYRQLDAAGTWSSSDPHPNEVVHRNFWFSSIEDPSAFRMLDLIGDDRVIIESDYPHADSTWPDTQHVLRSQLGHLDQATICRISWGTAAELYRHPQPPAGWISGSVVGRPGGQA